MIRFVYQNSPRGTGDAVLKCRNLIKSKYFLMLMPDDLIINNNCSLSMIKLHNKYNSSIIAAKKVNRKTVSRWGIFNRGKINKTNEKMEEEMTKEFINFYGNNINKESKLITGALEFLSWCKNNSISMAVCTNKQEHLSIDLLKKIKLIIKLMNF